MSHPLKRALLATAATALAVTLAACGSSGSASSSSSAAASTESAAASSAVSADGASGSASAVAFPVEITNAFGTTVIPAAPERVAVIGYTEGDTVLALGTVPVSFYEFAFPGEVGGPWATELLDWADAGCPQGRAERRADRLPAAGSDHRHQPGADPAAVRPAERHRADPGPAGRVHRLRRAADGAGPDDRSGAGQVGRDRGIGRGRPDRSIDDAKAANPDLEGKTVSVVWPTPDGSWFAYSTTDPRVRADGIPGHGAVAGVSPHSATDAFYHTISAENTAQIDADVIVVLDVNAQQATVRGRSGLQLPDRSQGRQRRLGDRPQRHRRVLLRLGAEPAVRP